MGFFASFFRFKIQQRRVNRLVRLLEEDAELRLEAFIQNRNTEQKKVVQDRKPKQSEEPFSVPTPVMEKSRAEEPDTVSHNPEPKLVTDDAEALVT
jgi:hypothetical protein